MPKFFGNREVQNIEQAENGYQKVTFTNGTSEILSEQMIGAVITDGAIDATAQREREAQAVVGEILKLMHNWNVKISDIDYILKTVVNSVNDSLAKGNDILWGQGKYEMRMETVHNVLVSQNVISDNTLSEVSAETPTEATPEAPSTQSPVEAEQAAPSSEVVADATATEAAA